MDLYGPGTSPRCTDPVARKGKPSLRALVQVVNVMLVIVSQPLSGLALLAGSGSFLLVSVSRASGECLLPVLRSAD